MNKSVIVMRFGKIFTIIAVVSAIYFGAYFVVVRKSCDLTSRFKMAHIAQYAMPRSSLRSGYPGDPYAIELLVFRPLILLDLKYFRSRWYYLSRSKSPKPSWVVEADTFMNTKLSDPKCLDALGCFVRDYKPQKVFWLTDADLLEELANK